MTSMPVAQRMTAEEFLDGPELERGVELVDGRLVVDEPLPRHQFICRDLLLELSAWTADAEGRGLVTLPLDVRLDEHNVYGPDILWYAEGRGPKRSGSGRPSPIPNLAVEVRSPSTWRYDIGTKKSVYEREGLPELWLVDTDGDVVVVFRRSTPRTPTFDVALEVGANEALTSPLLPGFSLPLGELFAR